jgi:hypothetical protein
MRAALASGAAGAVGCILLLTGRYPGTLATALLLALATRAAATAGAVAFDRDAARDLGVQGAFVPVWALAASAAAVRAGSAFMADVRGAHAVAGLAIVRGPATAVVGAWACTAALTAAIAAAGTPSDGGTPVLERLSRLAVALQAALVASFFAGPQVRRAGDAVPWVATIALVALGARLLGRERAARTGVAWAAAGLAAAGLALTLAGGRL